MSVKNYHSFRDHLCPHYQGVTMRTEKILLSVAAVEASELNTWEFFWRAG
jgi:hypothetical protein